MNFWGFLGLVFVWLSCRHYDDVPTFWCYVITAGVFFIASFGQWLRGIIYGYMMDDDYD